MNKMKYRLLGLFFLLSTASIAQDTKALFTDAMKQLQAGKLEEGIKLLDQVITQKPDEYPALYNRAIAKSMLRRYEEAMPDFEQAIKAKPDAKKAFIGRAIARKKLTNYDGALADLNKALQLDPNLGDAYYNRALIYEMLGQSENACKDFRVAQKAGIPPAALKVEICDNPLPNPPKTYTLLRLTETATDPKYGFLKENPVKVGPNSNDITENELTYLDLLRDAKGKPVRYRQTSSCCEYRSKTGPAKIDVFEVVYQNAQGQEKKASVYITFGDYEDPKILSGFKTVQSK